MEASGWNEAITKAFNLLKRVITSALVLALPDFNKTSIVKTDASMTRVGAVLMQEGHPTTFISKSLDLKQQVMSVYKREMMAILPMRLQNGNIIFGDATSSYTQIT